MGGKIPQPIRLAVIRKWLRGYSRDGIAKEEGIGNGTVSAILEQCRKEDIDFDLLRAVALLLKDRKIRIEDFAPLFRLKSMLEEKEVQLEMPQNDNLFSEYRKFEAIIIAFEVLCFKNGVTMDQFFANVADLYSLYERYGASEKGLFDYVVRLKHDIEWQQKEIQRLRLETKDEVERKGATMNLLQDYKANSPLFEFTKRELEKVSKERDVCQKQLENVREQFERIVWDKKEDEYGWSVCSEGADEAGARLRTEMDVNEMDYYLSRLSKIGLRKIIFDFSHYPSEYTAPIRHMIDIYDKLHSPSPRK
jgi:hypothetical protein